jgi:hypothetical protein
MLFATICDYFPEDPRAFSLSDVLASVAGVSHIDGLIQKSPKRKRNHQQRNQDMPIAVQSGRPEKRAKTA